MKKDLSRFITPEYIKRVCSLKPGARVRVLKADSIWASTKNHITPGQVCEVDHDKDGDDYPWSGPQKKWFRLKGYSGYKIGKSYVFEIIDDRIAYAAKNKPLVEDR